MGQVDAKTEQVNVGVPCAWETKTKGRQENLLHVCVKANEHQSLQEWKNEIGVINVLFCLSMSILC